MNIFSKQTVLLTIPLWKQAYLGTKHKTDFSVLAKRQVSAISALLHYHHYATVVLRAASKIDDKVGKYWLVSIRHYARNLGCLVLHFESAMHLPNGGATALTNMSGIIFSYTVDSNEAVCII